MSRDKLILLDAGHGGIVEGRYTTYPHKRHEIGDRQLNEGVLNRAVVHWLAFLLNSHNVYVHIISDSNKDTSLATRVKKINALAAEYSCQLYSIHHNYSDHVAARGCEIYTYWHDSYSDVLAEDLAARYYRMFPELKFRRYSITKASKEAGFYILKNTKCPAVLTEFSFMSNPLDFEYMIDGCGIEHEVQWLFDHIIKEYNK